MDDPHCKALGQSDWPHVCSRDGLAGRALARLAKYVDTHQSEPRYYEGAGGLVPSLCEDLEAALLYLGSMEEEVRRLRTQGQSDGR